MTKVSNANTRVKISVKKNSTKRNTRVVADRVIIYPMMPRKYTAAERAELRKFEQEIMAGKKISF